MIQWKDEYLIGVPEIDLQHKKLFEIADSIYDLVKNQFVTDKYDSILDLIAELKDYTVFHFEQEEKYMQSIGYKKFFTHKVEHDDFVEKINSYDLSVLDEDQDKHLIDILDFVVDWIVQHILEKDKSIQAGA